MNDIQRLSKTHEKGAHMSEIGPEGRGPQPPDESAEQSHTEPVEVDTIDGRWIVPVEVDGSEPGTTHIDIPDTTGAPVASEPSE